jgi:potassium-transporting ATPase KdpC subunit
MLSHLRPALVMIVGFTLLTGVAYPLAITGVAQLLPGPARGSLLRDGAGRVQGSALIGQAFARSEYLHGRPSAAGNGYDPTSSGGSNYGPMDPKLADRIKGDAAALAEAAPGAAIPADAVTASGSGLDPDISPAYAALQAPRIAAARHAPVDAVRRAIDGATRGPTLGVLGEARVNVLLVNRELDRALPLAAAAK